MKLVVILIAGTIFAAPVSARADGPTAAADDAAAKPAKPPHDPNRVICRVQEETGSLLAKGKVCMTAAEWKDRSYNSGQWVEHQSTYNSRPNGG